MADRPTLLTDYTDQSVAARRRRRPDLLAAGQRRARCSTRVLETSDGLSRREGERAAIVLAERAGHRAQHPALRPRRSAGSSSRAPRCTRWCSRSAGPLGVHRRRPPARPAARPRRPRHRRPAPRRPDQHGIRRRRSPRSPGVLTHQFRVVYARPQTLIPPDTFEVAASRARAPSPTAARPGGSRNERSTARPVRVSRRPMACATVALAAQQMPQVSAGPPTRSSAPPSRWCR